MGTYTTNKNLFMPTVGETGWGELVNGNFTTIDTFLKPISLSGSTYTFTGNQKGGSISATSITNSGTLTSTGKITANGGIVGTTGTFSGDVSGANASFESINAHRIFYEYILVNNNTELLGVNYLSFGSTNIVANGTFQINLLGNTNVIPGGTTTFNYRTYLVNTDYGGLIYCNGMTIKSGSWSYKLKTNHDVITATITDCTGKSYTANYNGVSITLAQVNTLLTGKNTVKVVSTNTTGLNGSVHIVVTNLNSATSRYFVCHKL